MRLPAFLLLVLLPQVALAAMPVRDPDWPCQQIKVPELSAGALWSGPPLDPFTTSWAQDTEVAGLVARLAQRRLPVEQAQTEIAAFAERAGPARSHRLTMLMAGLFDTLGTERASVLAGLDRYGRRQRAFAEQIRTDNAACKRNRPTPRHRPTCLRRRPLA